MRKNDLFKFRQRIIDIRQSKGMNQREFAAYLNIGPGRLANWESEAKGTVPAMITLEKLAARLNCSVQWLLGGEPALQKHDFPKNPRDFPHVREVETHLPKGVNYGQKEGVSMPMGERCFSRLDDLQRRADMLARDARRLEEEIAGLAQEARSQAAEPVIPVSGSLSGVPHGGDIVRAAKQTPHR